MSLRTRCVRTNKAVRRNSTIALLSELPAAAESPPSAPYKLLLQGSTTFG